MSNDIVARLRALAAEFPSLNGIMDNEFANAADEIERLRKERDEARRIICQDESYNHKSGVTPREVAIDRGWDCFKEKP